MGNFFGNLYCPLFEDFFGLELANYMWGISSPEQETNMFIGIGLGMLGISLFFTVLYYYVVNHPRLCNWWGWGIFLITNMIVNFIVGWQWVLTDLYAGKMFFKNPDNQQVPLDIYESNCICFGVSNMLLSMVAFFIISCIIKRWSTNVASAPFVK